MRETGRAIIGVAVALATLGASSGCRCRPTSDAHADVVARPVEILKKPAIDLSRGGAGFPLATTTAPTSATDVAEALRAGYIERLESPQWVRVDVTPGAKAGSLGRILIDISGSAVRSDFTPKPQPKQNDPVGVLHAGVLRYVADPLHYQHFTAGMRLEATGAALAVLPAGDGTFGLSLTDCRTGHASLTLSMDGLRESLAKGVQVKQSVAFMIDSIELALASDDARSLEADVAVHARVLLIPADFRLTGRIDVDDDFNVHFTKLNAAGLDPAGKVIAGIVQTRLDKLNDKAAPLLKLPGDRIKLSGLSMFVGDALTIEADLVGGGAG